jgi:hypothetical protein
LKPLNETVSSFEETVEESEGDISVFFATHGYGKKKLTEQKLFGEKVVADSFS